MPKFSIITPVYNNEAYLNRFLDSVTNQKYKDFEMFLVDDGSTDRSFEICQEYADMDSRITLLSQKNQGAGSARNLGITHSCGEYILFFDSDDWVSDELLRVLDNITSSTDVDLYLFGAKEIRFSSTGHEYERADILPGKITLNTANECRNIFCDLIFSSILNPPWNKVYRRTIIEKYNVVFPNVRRGQDAFFNMEYYRHICSLTSINTVLYYYRMNQPQNFWKRLPVDTYETDILYDRFLVQICKEFDIYSGNWRERVDTLFFNSLFRTVGLCRNKKFNMNLAKRLKYAKVILNDEYNQSRAKTALATTAQTKRIQSRIISKNARGILYDTYYYIAKDKLYNIYCKTVRKLIKGNHK